MNLADFQREGVTRAWQIIGERGGVLVADSVGLGKTFIGLGLIDLALREGRSTLVACPAGLRRLWKRELRKLQAARAVTVVSHTEIGLGRLADGRAFDFLVVDEAHAFRNPRTRRYAALRRIAHAARVALLTATPVNNSLLDLYFQLRLFCADTAFRDLGIGSLRAAFEENRDVDRVLRAVMLRRTRAEVRARESTLRFPDEVVVLSVAYELQLPVAQVASFLERLGFPALSGRAGGADLMRFALLKRLESSAAAISTSLGRQIRFYEQLARAVEAGATVSPRVQRAFEVCDDVSEQLLFDALLYDRDPAAAVLGDPVRKELMTLREWRAELARHPDDKLRRLVDLLERRRPGKTIVFSEFRDTARSLWRALRHRFAVGLIDGQGAWLGEARASRRTVVEHFAPVANGVRAPPRHAAVDVLIATDVLAEGLNLQDADAVVSFDLPWNPVRLIQRSGRIDRIGSPHTTVMVFNFIPDREFDALIGLARTLRTKLEAVRATVGLEHAVLEPDMVVSRLRTDSYSVLAEAGGATSAALRVAAANAHRPSDPRVPVARMGTGPPRHAIVGLSRGANWDVLVVDLIAGPAVTHAFDADAQLLAALHSDMMSSIDMRLVEAVAARIRSLLQDAPLSASAPAARLARRIRALLLNDADPAIFDRADRVFQALDSALSQVTEEALAGLARMRTDRIEELLAQTERVLLESRDMGKKREPWVVTGVLIVD